MSAAGMGRRHRWLDKLLEQRQGRLAVCVTRRLLRVISRILFRPKTVHRISDEKDRNIIAETATVDNDGTPTINEKKKNRSRTYTVVRYCILLYSLTGQASETQRYVFPSVLYSQITELLHSYTI